MAALTSDANRPNQGVTPALDLPVLLMGGTAFKIYKGAVVYSPVAGAGYARNFAGGGAAADAFLGVAAEYKDVLATDVAGAQACRVFRNGLHAFPIGTLVRGDLGKQVYVTTDQDLSLLAAAGANLWIGHLADIDAQYAWVDISRAAGMLNSAT